METYSLRPGRCWLVRAFGRNPLLRRSDRAEAVLLLSLVAVTLVAASFAGAIGTAVYDSRSRAYAEESLTRHPVTATVAADTTTTIEGARLVVRAPIRWQYRAVEHGDAIESDQTVRVGDRVQIWVDDTGSRVGAPRPSWSAAADAVFAALAAWLGLVAVIFAVCALIRATLTRQRAINWDRALRDLVDDRGGRTGPQS